MMKIPLGLFLASSSLALLPTAANATSLFRWDNRRENAGMFRIVPELSLLTTTENYDANGAKTTVSGLTSYKKNTLDLWGIYGIDSKLSAYARISMASVSFETSSLTASGSGTTEQGLGLNYRLWNSTAGRTAGRASRTTTIDGQFQLDFPLYDNVSSRSSNPRQPLRGDGTLDLTTGAFGTIPLNQGSGQRLYGILGLGYTIRNNNYSKAIPYQLQIVGLPERDGWMYRLGLHGFKSMTTDPATGTAISPQAIGTGTPAVDAQDAGRSLIVDALNSSYLTLRTTAGYQWGAGNQIFGSYLMTLSGTSTAALKGFLIGAQFRMGSSGSQQPRSTGTRNARGGRPGASYDVEGRVKQANDRLNLIKIDRGSNDGIEKGHVIDIFRVNPDGTRADLVARGVVTSVNETEAVVNLRQYKKEVWVQPGFIALRITPAKTR